MTRSRVALPAVALVGALSLAACGGNSDPTAPDGAGGDNGSAAPGTIVVGSADFPESQLLGELYAQALESKGVKVTRKFNIGSRERYLAAMTNGEVHVLPEYSGSLLTYYKKDAASREPDAVYAELQKSVPGQLTVLDKSAAEDKNSMVVTKETATQWSLKSVADLSAHGSDLTIAAPPEFKDRQQGLLGLKSVYNVTPSQFRPMKSAAVADALKNGQVKAANIFSTDPSITENGFVTLEDPKRLFGSDNVVPLVVKGKVSPAGTTALNSVSKSLDTATLAGMVKEVVVDHKDASQVAKTFLSAHPVS